MNPSVLLQSIPVALSTLERPAFILQSDFLTKRGTAAVAFHSSMSASSLLRRQILSISSGDFTTFKS